MAENSNPKTNYRRTLNVCTFLTAAGYLTAVVGIKSQAVFYCGITVSLLACAYYFKIMRDKARRYRAKMEAERAEKEAAKAAYEQDLVLKRKQRVTELLNTDADSSHWDYIVSYGGWVYASSPPGLEAAKLPWPAQDRVEFASRDWHMIYELNERILLSTSR